MGTSVGAWTFCYHKGTELEQARQARRARRAQVLIEDTGGFVEVEDPVHQPDEEVVTMIMANEEERGKIPAAAAAVEHEQLLKQEAAVKLNKSADSPGHNLEKLNGRMTTPLLFAVLAVTLGGSFQFGYNIGCVNAPGKLITNWFIGSHQRMFNSTMSKEQADVAWSVSVAIFSVGGMIGGLMSGWVGDRFGRKGGMLLNNVFAFMAAALMGMAKSVDVYLLIIIGRLIIGFNCGLNSGLVPMYLTEVSPINLRGTLGSVHQLMVTIAILIAQIIGLPYLLGNETWWPLILALTALPALFQVLTLPFCPETPKYNLIVKNRVEQAESDLKKLRAKNDVQEEMDVMHEEAAAIKSVAKVKMSDMFTKPALRWPMTIAIVMMLSQQLSGINAAMFYSTEIFRGAGLKGDMPIYATIGMGAVNVLMTIISVYLVDHPRFGRRSLHLAGLGGMWLSSILLVVCLSIFEAGKTPGNPDPTESSNQWASYLAIFFVLAFVVSFATGPGSIPWFYVSEIFASGSRGNANSIAVLVNWTANFVVSVSFLPLNNAIKQYSFLVFVFFLTLCWLFTFKFVPETKGRTVEEIVHSFEERARKNQ